MSIDKVVRAMYAECLGCHHQTRFEYKPHTIMIGDHPSIVHYYQCGRCNKEYQRDQILNHNDHIVRYERPKQGEN